MRNLYRKRTTICFIFTTFLFISSFAQDPHLAATPVITGLSAPIQVTNAGDGSNRLFVVLQGGTILVYDQSFNKLDTFLNVTNIGTGGERGLLSMAFHPEYGNIASPFHGMFFVYYTNSNGDLEIARYQVSSDPDSAAVGSKDTVITIPHPVNANHNGGTIRFGPDGYLYLATGDGGSGGDPPNNAQNPAVLLGKLLRIDVNSSSTAPFYTSPATNPYFGVTTPDTLDQIYAFGLRNPFRWSFDRTTHDLWIGDVGQGAFEEIDFVPADSAAGLNFGWSCYEGNAPFNPGLCNPSLSLLTPIFTYPNPGGAAVTGGVVYRGRLPANAPLVGYFIATDYYSGNFYKIVPNGSGWTVYTQNALKTGVPNIGEGENGEVYIVSQFAGDVSHITVDAVLPARLVNFAAIAVNDGAQLKWKTVFEENLSRFEVEYSTDGTNFQHAGTVAAANSATGASYGFHHTISFPGRLYYRLKMINIDNSAEFRQLSQWNRE
jgi:glucose/arabinose dehydrogenase